MSASVTPTVSAYTPAPPVAAATCPNCDAGAMGDFCHRCGGRIAVSRLTLRALGAEVLSQVVELDHGVLHTLVQVLRTPGETIRGYFAGRRRGLTSPLAFVTIAVAVTLLLATMIPSYAAMREEQMKALDQYRGLYSPGQYQFFVKLEHEATVNKALMLVMLLVPTTLTMRFLFRKQKLNLAETGALACYMYGAGTYIGLVFSVPLAFSARANADLTISIVTSIGILIYFSWGVYGRSFRTTWRAVWAFFCALLLMQAALVIAPYVFAR